MKFNKRVLMAEETGGEPVPQGGGETPPSETPPSGLPSEQPSGETPTGFEVKPEDLKDGKFQGRWTNPQEMAEYIKSMEDKHSELNRKIKDSEKQTDEEIAAMAAEAQQQELKDTTVKELLPEFLNNGMVVTDEMKAKLLETGLTEQDIKLGAYEMKEAVDKNASYVGGKENYDIIMDYHAQNMTDEEKIAFNHSIQDPKNSEALMVGLQTIYERNIGKDVTPQDRVRGNPVQNDAIKPYETKADLLRDKKYADSRVASSADKARFRARFKVTPENVWLS